MSRTVHIIGVGVGKNGRPYARGVVELESTEMAAALDLARRIGAPVPQAGFGLVSGLTDEAVAKLTPGDDVTAETVVVRCKPSSYDVDGEERSGIDFSIRLAGKATRKPAETAQADW